MFRKTSFVVRQKNRQFYWWYAKYIVKYLDVDLSLSEHVVFASHPVRHLVIDDCAEIMQPTRLGISDQWSLSVFTVHQPHRLLLLRSCQFVFKERVNRWIFSDIFTLNAQSLFSRLDLNSQWPLARLGFSDQRSLSVLINRIGCYC